MLTEETKSVNDSALAEYWDGTLTAESCELKSVQCVFLKEREQQDAMNMNYLSIIKHKIVTREIKF